MLCTLNVVRIQQCGLLLLDTRRDSASASPSVLLFKDHIKPAESLLMRCSEKPIALTCNVGTQRLP